MPVDVPGGSPTAPPSSGAAGTVTPAAPAGGAGGPGDQSNATYGNAQSGQSPHAADRKAASALRNSPAVQVSVRGRTALQNEDGPNRMRLAARGLQVRPGAPASLAAQSPPGSLHPLEAAYLQTAYAEHAARAARTAALSTRGAARSAAGQEGTLLVRLVLQSLQGAQARTPEQREALALLRTFAGQGADPAGVRPELLLPGTLGELRGALEVLLRAGGLAVLQRGDGRAVRSPDGTFSWASPAWPPKNTLGSLALRVGAVIFAGGLVVLWLSWLR